MKKITYLITIILLSIITPIIPQSYSEMYSSTPPIQNGISGWTTVTGFTAGDASSDFSFASNSLTKSSASDLYVVSFSISFAGSVTGQYEIGISVNNSDPLSIRVLRSLTNNDAGNASAHGYLTLNSGDFLNLKIIPPSTANLTVRYTSVSLVRVADVAAYNTYAEMGFYNNSASINLSTSFSTITNASYLSSNLQNWTHSAGVLTSGTGSEGVYLISASFSFSGQASSTYDFGVSINDNTPSQIIGGRKISNANDIGNISIWGIVNIADGNTIQLKAKADGNKTLTVRYCHIYLTKISGSGNTPENFPYASMSISNETTPPVTALTAGTNTKITGFSNDVTDNNYWVFSNNEFSPIGISAGYYRINYFISCVTSSATTVTFTVLNNGVPIQQLTNVRTTSSSTDRGAIGGNGIILISNPTDKICLAANPLVNVNLSVYRSRLSLSRIEKTSDTPLPVELSSFSAVVLDNGVKLKWKTVTEVNNYGFDVERQVGNGQLAAGNWEKIGFEQGFGNSNSPKEYYFFDDLTLTPNLNHILRYRLKQIDTDGNFEYSKVIEVDLGSPQKFQLSQNYPNPFNPSTTISFSLPQSGIVKLTVYNILGEQVAELVNGFKEAGVHTINFSAKGGSAFGGNANALQSGLYIYRIEANGFVQSRKMTLVK